MSRNQEPSNSQLHILLTQQRGDLKLILSKMDDFTKWKELHEENDKIEHAAIHKRVSDMRSSMGNVAVVSVVVGFLVASASKLKGLFS